MSADLVGIQRLQEGQNGLQVLQVLLLHFLSLLNGGYDFGHIGGKLGHSFCREIVFHAGVQRAHDTAVTAEQEIPPLTQAAFCRFNAIQRRVNHIQRGRRHQTGSPAKRRRAQLIHLGYFRAQLINGLLCTGHVRSHHHMQRSVRIQHGYLVGGQQFRRHSLHRDFLSVLPEFRFGIEQHVLWVFVQLAQLDDALHFYGIFRNEFSVGNQVITIDTYGHGQLGLDGITVVILGDICREVLQKFRFIAACGLGKPADDGLDLGGGKLGYIHVFRFEVFGHHGRDVIRGQLSRQRSARHFLIGQYKGGDTVRGQPTHVYAVFLHVLGDVGSDFGGLQRGYVRPGSQFLIGADHSCDVFRSQARHVCTVCDFGIGADQPNQPFGRERSLVRTLRDFGVLGDERFNLGLQLLRRSVLLIAGHNHVRGNRTGIFRKGIPALLRPGHVEISGDFKDFLRQRFAEHGGQAGQFHLAVVEKGLNGRDLFQRSREVNFREHGLNLAFGHAAVQKRLNLGEHGDVLGHRALIHGC